MLGRIIWASCLFLSTLVACSFVFALIAAKTPTNLLSVAVVVGLWSIYALVLWYLRKDFNIGSKKGEGNE